MMTNALQVKQKVVTDYWLERMSGDLRPLTLPFSSRRKGVDQRERIQKELPGEVALNLQKIAKSSDMALLLLLLAGLKVLLYRYTQTGEIIVGTVTPNQSSEEARLVLLRNVISNDQTVGELIGQMKNAVLRDFNYSDYSFSDLYEQWQTRGLKMADFYQVGFLFEKNQKKLPCLDQFKLLIMIHERETGWVVSAEFEGSWYSCELISLFLDNYIYFFTTISSNLHQPIGQLEILSPREREICLQEWNQTDAAYPQEYTLHQLFEEQAERTPEQIAVTVKDQSISYGELNRRANQMARLLRRKGVKPDQVVGLLAESSLEVMIGMIGILKAGAAFLPIEPDYPLERIQYILADSRATILLRSDHDREKRLQTMIEEIDLYDVAIFSGDSANVESVGSANNLAYLMYTSGSTGRPKGVMIEHSSIVNQLYGLMTMYSFEAGMRHILLAPFTFDPSVQQIFLPLATGGRVYLVTNEVKLDPEQLLDMIVTEQIQLVNTVPSMMKLMLGYAYKYGTIAFSYVILAGEPFTYALYQQLQECLNVRHLINIYGPTEATINTTLYECTEEEEGIIPIGKPLRNYQVYVLDEQEQVVPIGVAGELCIAGVGLARGYLNSPELNETKLVPNPFKPGKRMYKTGDLVKWSVDGNLIFVDRLDHQIKIGGQRIEPGEIEDRLRQEDEVEEAVVLALKTPETESYQLVACLVMKTPIPESALRAKLKEKLPAYMIPGAFIYLEQMPLTANDKIDRKALLEIAVTKGRTGSYVAPQNELEKELQQIWEEVLGVEQIGVMDNLYEIGGNSLKTITLITAIHRRWNVKLEIQEVFAAPTIQQLSVVIQTRSIENYVPIPKIPEKECYEITHTQQRMWIAEQLTKQKEMYNMADLFVIEGELDRTILGEVLNNLVKRHESLRTIFVNIEGRPVQKVLEKGELPLRYVDFRGLGNADQLARDEALREIAEPFELTVAPLIRTSLLQVAEQRYYLVLTMHHIISDTWSMGIFFNELIAYYLGHSKGVQSFLPELSIQYKDYAAWLAQELSQNRAKYENYWHQQFATDLPVLDLPTDAPRPGVRSKQGGKVMFLIPAELATGIDVLCKEHQVTQYMALLSSVYLLLYRYTGQTDIAVSTLSAARNHPDLKHVIGFFVNTLALRVQMLPEESFESLMEKVKVVTLGAYEHQIYSFDSLVDFLRIKRNPHRSPITDISFDVMERVYHVDIDPVAGIKVDYIDLTAQQEVLINVDLSFKFARVGEIIQGTILYSKDLFTQSRIELMAARYLTLLKDILEHPKTSLASADFSVEEEMSGLEELDVDFDL